MCSKTPWEKLNINYSTFMISCMPAASFRVFTCHPFCLCHINIIYVLLLCSFAASPSPLSYVSSRAMYTAVVYYMSVILYVYKLRAMSYTINYILNDYLYARMAGPLHKHSMTLPINSWYIPLGTLLCCVFLCKDFSFHIWLSGTPEYFSK